MRVRCDSDDEIVPIISGRSKTEFTKVSRGTIPRADACGSDDRLPLGGSRPGAPAWCLACCLNVQEDLEKLRHPHLLGGATIGDELGERQCCSAAVCTLQVPRGCARFHAATIRLCTGWLLLAAVMVV